MVVDPFGREITYVRLSLTDRCDFRCVYCMAENMTFLPKKDLLSLEELDRLGAAFVDLGVRKIRLTGGEPLVRRNVMWLIRAMGRHVALGRCSTSLRSRPTAASSSALRPSWLKPACGASTSPSTRSIRSEFAAITRWGKLDRVMAGIAAARRAGLAVKINAVALKGVNEDEIDRIIAWCGAEGFDLTLIETMPLGEIEGDRTAQYLPLSLLRSRLEKTWTLEEIPYRTGGPARYVRVRETGGRLGFITPLTHNFCESCNRVRVTCTGTMYMCLGQEDRIDLRAPLRASESNEPLHRAILDGIARKPKGHDFVIDRRHNRPAVGRHMSVTGG